MVSFPTFSIFYKNLLLNSLLREKIFLFTPSLPIPWDKKIVLLPKSLFVVPLPERNFLPPCWNFCGAHVCLFSILVLVIFRVVTGLYFIMAQANTRKILHTWTCFSLGNWMFESVWEFRACFGSVCGPDVSRRAFLRRPKAPNPMQCRRQLGRERKTRKTLLLRRRRAYVKAVAPMAHRGW